MRVGEALARLAVESHELPAPVLARLNHRARSLDARLVVGRYLIVGELGRGGMGVVYDAWDPGIERRVAIKTIEPELVPEEDRDEIVARFRRETKIVGKLQHPAIVTIFDFGQERAVAAGSGATAASLLYYVMEYLEGQSLAQVLREQGALTDHEAVKIAADIAEALQLSHDAGIIHRDIKPSNIFLRNGREAVLLDFGIAKQGSQALTRQGQILGTPSYLAPERLKEKEHPIDGRADIFSLGVLLYTMLTGEAPFVGHSVYEVIDKIAKQDHPHLGRPTPSGRRLSWVLDRMLAKHPGDRYQSAVEASRALRELHAVLDPASGAGPVPEMPDDATTSPSQSAPVFDDDHAAGQGDLDAVRPDDEPGIDDMRVDAGPREPDTVRPSDPLTEGAEAPDQAATRVGRPPGPPPLPGAPLRSVAPQEPLDAGSEVPGVPALPRIDDLQSFGHGSHPAPWATETNPQPSTGAFGASTEPRPRVFADPSAAQAAGGYSAAGTEEATEVAARASEASGSSGAHPLADPLEVAVDRAQAYQAAGTTAQVTGRRPPPLPRLRSGRSPIEAELVDESQVVVRPAFDVAIAPRSELDDDLSPWSDPVRSAPVRSAPDSASPYRTDAYRPSSTGRARGHDDPAETRSAGLADRPTSAAVARRTIAASPARATPTAPMGSSVQVRTLGLGEETGLLVKRRIMVLLAGGLASAAIGLLLGRMQQGAPESGLVTAAAEAPRARPLAAPADSEPALVRPRTARELVLDGDAALDESQYDNAARLYTRALASLPETHPLTPGARLGRADALRGLERLPDALAEYREIVRRHPQSSASIRARDVLRSFGVRIKAPPRRNELPTKPPVPLPPKPAPKAPAAAPDDLSPQEACRWVLTRHLTDARAAVSALEDLREAHPTEPCVFWNLGRKYEAVKQYRSALSSYRRFLMLRPDSPKAPAVQRRVTNLQTKIRVGTGSP